MVVELGRNAEQLMMLEEVVLVVEGEGGNAAERGEPINITI